MGEREEEVNGREGEREEVSGREGGGGEWERMREGRGEWERRRRRRRTMTRRGKRGSKEGWEREREKEREREEKEREKEEKEGKEGQKRGDEDKEGEKEKGREMDFSLCGLEIYPQQPPNISRGGMDTDRTCVCGAKHPDTTPTHTLLLCQCNNLSREWSTSGSSTSLYCDGVVSIRLQCV